MTQAAPPVWSTPDTPDQTTPSPDAGTETIDPLASSVTALPGLTTLCTATIHAQSAVNSLFASGLASVPTSTETGAIAGMLPTTAPSSAGAPLPSAAEITALFAKIMPQVPPSLATEFSTLEDASLKVADASPEEVPDILAAKPVVGAMQSISDYIVDCTPATTD